MMASSPRSEQFAKWQQSLKNVKPNSPFGHLMRLQQLYSDPLSSNIKNIDANRAFHAKRNQQIQSMSSKENVDAEFIFTEPSELTQTFYMQKMLFEPMLNALPD